jgi:diguanylate cyclase (GGDEF)-like protein
MKTVIVDNSKVGLKILHNMLTAGGHTAVLFDDGQLALDYLNQTDDVDVLITGLELRSLSGMELCWETRLIAESRHPIYIIAMSSNYDTATLSKALDSGADDFINKPLKPEGVYARLRAAGRLITMQDRLIHLATTDPLTGLLNRRAFFEKGEFLLSEAGTDPNFSIVLFDIDHFKKVNDTHGHAVGDIAIREVASCASNMFDVVGRIGGEEFTIILPNHDGEAALRKAEGLRQKIAELKIPTASNPVGVTCSFGVSNWMSGDNINKMLNRADMALYQAKETGRNKSLLYSSAKSILEFAD